MIRERIWQAIALLIWLWLICTALGAVIFLALIVDEAL